MRNQPYIADKEAHTAPRRDLQTCLLLAATITICMIIAAAIYVTIAAAINMTLAAAICMTIATAITTSA